jgi:HEAT repeat protein
MRQTIRWVVLAVVVGALAFAVAHRSSETPPPPPPSPASPYAVALDMTSTVKDLSSDDDGVADAAVDTLVAQGPAALAVLTAVLEHEPPEAREKAIEALRQLKLPESVPILMKALAHDDDADVRYDSALLLAELGDPRAREPVEAALRDPTWDVRLGAARACAKLCTSPEAVDRLVWMAIYDEPVQSGIWARSSLVKMMQTPAGDSGAAELAARVRAAIDKSARPVLAGGGDLEPRVRAALLVSDLGDRSVSGALREAAATDLNPILMPYPLYTLGEIGDAESVPALTHALGSDRMEVRLFSYDALRKLDERNVSGAAAAMASFTGQKPNGNLPSPLP